MKSTEIKTFNGVPIADTKAREDISALKEDLMSKTEKVQIDFDGTNFKYSGQTLNYKQLHDYHRSTPDFTFVVYGDRAYLLSYDQADASAMREMRFQSVLAVTDANGISNVKTSGIYVTSSDGVNITSVKVTDVNSENKSYKVDAITDANKGNTVMYPSVKAVADVESRLSESIVEIQATKEDAYGNIIDIELPLTNEWFYENGTNVGSPASYARTGKFDVSNGEIIFVSGMSTRVVAEKTLPTALFLDDNNSVVSCIYTDVNNTLVKSIVPNNATKIFINGNKDTAKPFLQKFVKGNLVEDVSNNKIAIAKESLNNDLLKYLYSNVICIGDSITEGYRSAEIGVIKSKSYPSYLAKMTGWNVTNGGKSGITSSGWWREEYSKYNFADYDMAIMNLGQNNGLTDTLQADVIAHNHDYTNFATTTTGRYCMIIEGALLQNPNIQFYLVKGQKDATTNKVISDISEYYGFPLLDVDDTTLFDLSQRMYHPSGYTVHYGTLGYVTLAKQMLWQICKYLEDNKSTIYTRFENY